MARKKIRRKVVDGRLVKLTKAQVRKAVAEARKAMETKAWQNSFEEGYIYRYYGADFYVTDQIYQADHLITNVTD